MANTYKHSGSSVSQGDWDNALELAENWKDIRNTVPGKNLGALARAFLHLKVCYEEMVKLSLPDCDTASVPEEPRILDEREVVALAKKSGLPKYMDDTATARMALARFAHEVRLDMNHGGDSK